MNHDQFNHYCAKFVGHSYVCQWGGAHVHKVGGKVFAIGTTYQDSPAYSFKVSPHNYELLQDQTGFRPAPYLASRGMKWIQQYRFDDQLAEHLKYYLSESHRLVGLGLTKKRQRELGLLT